MDTTTTPTTSSQQNDTTTQSDDPLSNNDDNDDEDDRVNTGPDGRVYFVAEQVSHHPPSKSNPWYVKSRTIFFFELFPTSNYFLFRTISYFELFPLREFFLTRHGLLVIISLYFFSFCFLRWMSIQEDLYEYTYLDEIEILWNVYRCHQCWRRLVLFLVWICFLSRFLYQLLCAL